jgi:hypothetical protein
VVGVQHAKEAKKKEMTTKMMRTKTRVEVS